MISAFGNSTCLMIERAQTRPADFARHSTLQPSHLLKASYIPSGLRANRL